MYDICISAPVTTLMLNLTPNPNPNLNPYHTLNQKTNDDLCSYSLSLEIPITGTVVSRANVRSPRIYILYLTFIVIN